MKAINKNLITIALASISVLPVLSQANDLKMNIKTNPTPKIVGGEPVTDNCDNEVPENGYLFSGELDEGIEGDADIYVKHQQQNTMSDYDFAPLNWVNDEQVLIKRPQQGTWYIKIIGYEAYHDLELMGFAR